VRACAQAEAAREDTKLIHWPWTYQDLLETAAYEWYHSADNEPIVFNVRWHDSLHSLTEQTGAETDAYGAHASMQRSRRLRRAVRTTTWW
jgi:hypothetical protein